MNKSAILVKDGEQTQREAIRELMLRCSRRGDWLTLAEIAEHTEFGPTSISAQLRHLRKRRFGNYHVEKRRRRLPQARSRKAAAGRFAPNAPFGSNVIWEYGVFPRGGTTVRNFRAGKFAM